MLQHRRNILFSFCVAILVLCAVALSVYSSFAKLNGQKLWVDHTYNVIGELQDVFSNMIDVQASQRGYVITGLEDYLAPYYIALPKVEGGLRDLSSLLKDNPEQKAALDELQIHVDKRIKAAEDVITAYQKSGQKAAMDLVKAGTGKREMDEIRAIVASMVAHEENLLAVRRVSVQDYFKITMYAGLGGLLVFIAILSAVFITMNKEVGQRLKSEDSLRDVVSQMEQSNAETQVISRLGDYLRSCREESEAYDMIAKSIPMIFPQSYGSVGMFNNSRNILRPVLTWGDVPEEASMEFEPEGCWALRQGRVHMCNFEGAAPICHHLEYLPHDNMTLCLPMQAQGETIGQIFIGAKKSARHEVTRRELGTMRRVTEQISLALANLNLQRALREQSIKDPLTKLYNRRYLEETLTREMARARRNEQAISILLMDIDHFKKVNDTYGHDAGDAVLVAFSKLLSSKIRKEDIACRWGGEEFILVLGNASAEHGMMRAQEVCDATRTLKVVFQGKTIPITTSIGVAVFPEHGEEPQELIQNADSSLYKAKQGGRDRVVLYTQAT